mmetsp:Transcript_31274/g.50273  ORF Transcript_31274/g.50273 Transcript_31274/m.50273 type:complete len:460 (+) Transcript_31274:278-1657(+)
MAQTTEEKTQTGVELNEPEAAQKDEEEEAKTLAAAKAKTPTWLSYELRLDDFSIKNQAFTVTGWISTFWKWTRAPESLKTFNGDFDIHGNDKNKEHQHVSEMIIYQNSLKHEIVKIVDLRRSDISYYLPIDARRIFYQPSLNKVEHIDAPCLYYDKQTELAWTQYYVTASLLEHLELFMFPFDRQFLNIKLRFNVDYYRILDYELEKEIPLEQNWWGDRGERSCERNLESFHSKPLKVSLKESLLNEVKLYPSWVDFRVPKSTNAKVKAPNLRFAMISLRIKRNPNYFVSNIIFPFFVIVASSFSVFAIPPSDPGDRLSVSVTILLTFTAFQSIIAAELPQTAAMLFIDWYIGIAYTIQALLILGSCIASMTDHLELEVIQMIDYAMAIGLGSMWIALTLFYLLMRSKTFRACYDRCCICCCFRKVTFNDWDIRSSEEIEAWIKNDADTVGFDRVKREE